MDIEDIDFSEIETPITPLKPGRGGARRGAGGKPKGYVPPPYKVDYESARARNETAKAQINELQFEIDSGNYVARASIRQASATAMATLAQGLRGLEDALERQGVPVPVCQKVGVEISRALEQIGKELEQLAGHPGE